MRIVNISRKVVNVLGKNVLPGEELRLEPGDEGHPEVQFYLRNRELAPADDVAVDTGSADGKAAADKKGGGRRNDAGRAKKASAPDG